MCERVSVCATCVCVRACKCVCGVWVCVCVRSVVILFFFRVLVGGCLLYNVGLVSAAQRESAIRVHMSFPS